MVCSGATESTTQGGIIHVAALESKGLAHDRTAAAKKLQVRHFAATDRGMMGNGSGEGTKSGRASLAEEWAKSLRLAQKCLHDACVLGLYLLI